MIAATITNWNGVLTALAVIAVCVALLIGLAVVERREERNQP